MYKGIREADHSKCVIVVRNPFDTFMAEFARMRGGHTGSAKIRDRNSLITYRKEFAQSEEAASWYWGGAGYSNLSDALNFNPHKFRGLSGRWLRSYRNSYNYCTNSGGGRKNGGVLTDSVDKSALIVLYENWKTNKVTVR